MNASPATEPPLTAPRPDVGQERLRALLARRIATARPELAGRHDLTDPAGLRAAQEEITGGGDGNPPVSVVVVLSRFDLATWVRESCRFAAGLDEARAAQWRRSFTRTLFLAGDPVNLRERFTFAQVSEDATVAWSGPAVDAASTGLRRLLRTYDGVRPFASPPRTVRLPAPGPAATWPAATGSPRRPGRWRVEVSTVGVCVADVLVHLNHLLAEAVLDGLVGPGDEVTVRPAPRLVAPWESYSALRIGADSRAPERLRAYAGLTRRAPEDDR